MDRHVVLFEAARDGKIGVLERELKENPSVLSDIRIVSLSESLLHVATKSGKLNFVHELMKIDSDLAREVNKEGFRPLDIAVILGNLEIVKEILSFNRDLCRLKGKDMRTALHYAAIKGRVDIIDELLSNCPDSIRDITFHGETALHLAVKYYQFDAFADLIKCLEILSMESLVNARDGDGDSVLHIAVSTKQHACLNLLLDENNPVKGTLELNLQNGKGLTAIDILDIVMQDSYDAKVKETLQRAGAIRSQDSVGITSGNSVPVPIQDHFQPEPSRNWFEYFKFQKRRDSPSDTRNALLVVAALIATVSFQAGVDPPNGLFDSNNLKSNSTNQPHDKEPPRNPAALTAGLSLVAIFGSHATSFFFLFANSLGLTASTCVIIYLTGGFPFQRELHISLYSMMFTYGFATSIITKEVKNKGTVYALLTVAFILPFAQRWIPIWGKRAWNKWRKRAVSESAMLPTENRHSSNYSCRS